MGLGWWVCLRGLVWLVGLNFGIDCLWVGWWVELGGVVLLIARFRVSFVLLFIMCVGLVLWLFGCFWVVVL